MFILLKETNWITVDKNFVRNLGTLTNIIRLYPITKCVISNFIRNIGGLFYL
jgi:hypothetical protein